MSSCHTFRPVPGQCGPRGRGPLPAPPFDPQDYWATRKLVSSLVGALETSKLDRTDVVDPSAATEDGKAADAKRTQEEIDSVLGVASGALALAESKADKLSSQQLDAVNSGIDAAKVAKIAQNETAISDEVSRATTEEARLRELVNAIKTFDAVVADSLPDPSEQYSRKLYLVPSTNPETRNVRDEFICVKIEGVWGWEQVGSTAITIEFDDEPTEGSQNASRSGGIWSWVKSLLPLWLTSDYAEPATVASVNAKADRSALTAHTENTNNPHSVTAEQIWAVPFVKDKAGEKTAVTIGRRLSGIVGPSSLVHGYNGYAEGEYSCAAGYSTSAVGNYSRADGGFTQAVAEGSYASGIRARTLLEDAYSFAWNGNGDPDYGVYYSHGPGTFNVNPIGGLDGFYIGEQTLSTILTNKADKTDISATNPTFSNEVLAVGLNIDTNSVAVLNEIAATFGGFPLGAGETATTVGGLLAALAAASAWLKKNKVGSFESVGGASATVENGVANLNGFFTESNSLLTGTIDAEVISKGTAPDAHLEAPTDEHLKLILADNSVAYDSAKALPYKLTSAIGDRVIATMTLTAASTDITLPTISANDTTVKDFILDVTNAYAVEGVATDAGINIPRTDFKLVTRDGESLTDVTTVKAGKSAFICFTQKSPVVVDGTTYPCWCVIQLPFGDPS